MKDVQLVACLFEVNLQELFLFKVTVCSLSAVKSVVE